MEESGFFVHPTSVVDEGSVIGKGTKIWHFCHIMPGCRIGEDCILGQNVMIASGVVLGNRVILMSKHGKIKINMPNDIPKPVTPASEGYGALWKELNDALWAEDEDEGAAIE